MIYVKGCNICNYSKLLFTFQNILAVTIAVDGSFMLGTDCYSLLFPVRNKQGEQPSFLEFIQKKVFNIRRKRIQQNQGCDLDSLPERETVVLLSAA